MGPFFIAAERLKRSRFDMAMLQQQLHQLLEPSINALGFELWGLQLITGGKRQTLRVFIDAEQGVTVDGCAQVSRQIGAVLDVEDPLSSDYILEVSSPGVDRYLFKLEHYAMYRGQKLKVKLKLPYMGRRNYTGILTAIENDDEIVLHVDNEEYLLPFDSIERAQCLL